MWVDDGPVKVERFDSKETAEARAAVAKLDMKAYTEEIPRGITFTFNYQVLPAMKSLTKS